MDGEPSSAREAGDREAFERLALMSAIGSTRSPRESFRDRKSAAKPSSDARRNLGATLPASDRSIDRGVGLSDPRKSLLPLAARPPAVSGPTPDHADGAVVADGAAMLGVRDALERAFARLSPDHRAVITLHYLRDLTQEEVAEWLGISAGTVKSRLHHARRLLRRGDRSR